jgi:hypothetical protein
MRYNRSAFRLENLSVHFTGKNEPAMKIYLNGILLLWSLQLRSLTRRGLSLTNHP